MYKKARYLLLLACLLISCAVNAQINRRVITAEYYIDTDPGTGLATPLLAADGNFTDAFEAVIANNVPLTLGNHTVGVRIKDFSGNWSPTFTNAIVVGALPRTINVSLAEYFIDTDPGVGLATPLLAFDGNFNNAFETVIANGLTLTQGNHLIGVRVKDVANNWSPTVSNTVAVGAATRTINITAAEYFIDTDPGVGIATPLLAFDGNFNNAFETVAANPFLTAGNHLIGVRVKDVANNWSPTFSNVVNVQGLRTIRLTAAEYFIDTDPGDGLATPMLAFDGNFNNAFETVVANGLTLTQGNHLIGVRVKDFDNNWSPTFSNIVAVGALPRTIRLSAAEYFIDTDPGVGLATTMLAFDGNFTDAFETVMANGLTLTAGNHLIGVRVKDFDNNWSPTFSNVVAAAAVRTMRLTAAEYFIDTDPGVGIATPLLAFDGNFNDAFESVTANGLFLTAGNHLVGVRVKDFDGNWSPTFSNVTNVQGLRTIRLTAAEYFIDTDPGAGLATPMLAFNGSFNDAFETVIANGLSLTAGNHTIGVRVKDFDNNWSPTFSNTVAVGAATRTIRLTQAEYFIDTDPGDGLATPLLAFDGNFTDAFEAVAANPFLTAGNHLIGVRVKDFDGNWSPTFSNVTNVQGLRNIRLTLAEYFIDIDPGAGLATPMLAFNGNFNDAFETVIANGLTLTQGNHTIGVRVKDFDNNWSPTFSNTVAVGALPRTILLTQAEYFWDTDPGQGNGTPLLAFDGSFNNAFETAAASGITPPAGIHKLSVRVKDVANNWSPVFSNVFVSESCDTALITATSTITCPGATTVFTATFSSMNGTPAFQWKVNNANAGTNAPNFTSSTLINGDVVTCVVTSAGAGCVSGPQTSNSITMTGVSGVVPLASIGAGSTAIPCTGNAVALTAVASNATPNNMVQFDGVNDHVTMPDFGIGTSNFTIEAWIRPNVLAGYIISNRTSEGGAAGNWFNIQVSGTGKLTVEFATNNSTYQVFTGTLTIVAGAWSHIAVVRNGTSILFYVNGNLDATFSDPTVRNLFGTSGILGGFPNFNAAWYNGQIDEFRIWNVVRTIAQINGNRFTSIPGSTAGLTRYYKMNEASGTVISSSSGSLNQGTLVNGAVLIPSTAPVNPYFTYLWSPGGATTPAIGAATSGSYTVLVTNDLGCATLSPPVTVTNAAPLTPPVITPANPVNLCQGQSVTLSANYPVGKGLQFSGGTDYVNVPDAASHRLSTAFTMEAWINPTNFNDYRQIINKFGSSGSYAYMFLTDATTGRLRLDVSMDGVTPVTLISTTSTTAGIWQHVAVTWNGSAVTFYINGVAAGTGSLSGTLYQSSVALNLGRRTAGGTQPFIGRIDDVRIWDVALSQAQIQAWKDKPANPSHPSFPNLKGYWKLDEGTGTTASDASAFGNTGTLSGSPLPAWINSGALSYYQWSNGLQSPTAFINASGLYTVTCTTTEGCTSTSAVDSVTIHQYMTPAVSIASDTTNTICDGTNVTFTATPVNGGLAPSYQWKKNNVNTGTNSVTYSNSALVSGDVITCVMTSNYYCLNAPTAGSNSITITVTPNVTPLVSIAPNTSTTICEATNVTFTATPTFGGATPAYQWKKNNSNVGTNSATYADNALASGDIITCELTSSALCVTSATANSNTVTMTVNPNVIPDVTVAATATNICIGNPVTFTATPVNGGVTPTYQWKKNNINVGTNSDTYADNTLANGDIVVCILTSSEACPSPLTDTSTAITIVVNTTAPAQPAPVTGAPLDICPPATGITLSVLNDPSASSYTWTVAPGSNGITFNPPSTTNTQVIDLSATVNTTYGIRVVANNACGVSVYRGISIRRAVSTPAAVTGPATACASATQTYSTGAVTGATSYLWSAPAGSLINGNATPFTTPLTSVSVTFPAGFTSGTVGAAAQVACFTSTVKTIAVSTSAPVLGLMAGNAVVCPGQTYAYSVPPNAANASYTWTLPAGATGTSSTNSINVTYGASVPSANVCVTATSICGVATVPKCKSVAPGIPAQPASIIGPTNGLCNQTINYQCPSQASVTYNWTSPAGSIINSGQTTNGISITFPTYSDVPAKTLCVTASNTCGTSAPRCITVRGAPNTPAAITANPTAWCANTSGIQFTANLAGVTGGYTLSWTYPGPTVASYVIGGGNTTTLLLDWLTGSGNVSVTAQNACGSGTRNVTFGSTCREDEQIGAEVTTMQIYPNPSTGIINIDFTAKTLETTTLTITDMAGRIVASQTVAATSGSNHMQLDLSDVAKGVYIVNLDTQSSTLKSRIVIE